MEITTNSNLIPFLNKKVRVITEINSVFIGKLYFIDGKKNFKLSNCREFITRFGVYRYNGFFKNVNFNGGKKMTIDFDFNYPPVVTANSTISSKVYSCQDPSKSYEKFQGKQTRESDVEPMFYDLEKSRSSRRIAQGNREFKPSETFLPNARSMFCDLEDLGDQRSGLPQINFDWSNLQENQRVEGHPEMFPKVELKKESMSDFEKPSTSQRIIPGNQRIAPSKSFPHHLRTELAARSTIDHSKGQRSFPGNQKIGPPETVTNWLNVKTKLGNSEKIKITPEYGRVQHSEVSLRDVTNNSKYVLDERSGAFQKSNQGKNQYVASQDVFDETKRMEALSMACNFEMPSNSQRNVQENQNGLPFYTNKHENIKLDEERSVIPYNLLTPAAQNLPAFPNIERQNVGNPGSYNISTHALICVPVIINMELRLTN